MHLPRSCVNCQRRANRGGRTLCFFWWTIWAGGTSGVTAARSTKHRTSIGLRDSMRFTQAYAACHVCSPTRASILTGKYPARLHLTDWLPGRKDFAFQKLKNARIQQHLPLAEVTLAEVLKKHGYRTAHIGKWHLGEEPYGPLAQGFDVQVPRWNKGWPKAGYYHRCSWTGFGFRR